MSIIEPPCCDKKAGELCPRCYQDSYHLQNEERNHAIAYWLVNERSWFKWKEKWRLFSRLLMDLPPDRGHDIWRNYRKLHDMLYQWQHDDSIKPPPSEHIRERYEEDKALLTDDSQWSEYGPTTIRDRAVELMRRRGIDLAAFGVKA